MHGRLRVGTLLVAPCAPPSFCWCLDVVRVLSTRPPPLSPLDGGMLEQKGGSGSSPTLEPAQTD